MDRKLARVVFFWSGMEWLQWPQPQLLDVVWCSVVPCTVVVVVVVLVAVVAVVVLVLAVAVVVVLVVVVVVAVAVAVVWCSMV